MKTLIENYTFDASAKTITFSDYAAISLNRVLLITNVTDGVILYNFADPATGGSVATNVLTLDYDTTAMDDTDALQIFYDDENAAQTIQAAGAAVERTGFAKEVSNNVDSAFGSIIGSIGTGMGVNQTGGKLVLTAGTTARAETILRSAKSFTGGIRLRAKTTLSQRIANNKFFIELVDVVGDGLAYTISSATVMVVTFPTGTNPFTTENIGQSMYAGNFVGTGTFLSGRYAISAVSGDTVTFTVSGFAAGSGTLSLFGWNYYHVVYDGTTATNAKFDTQRRGYNTGDTTATISTTASGHVAIVTGNDMVSIFSDQVVTSSATVRTTVRASRDENVPDDAELYLQIRMANGSTAPASGTTWTIGMVAVSEYTPMDTVIQDLRQTTNVPLPVDILRSVNLTTSTTVTANQGTLQAGTTYNLVTTASTNTAAIKASAGNLYEFVVSNPTATPIYVKLYNKATAPTLASDVPVLTIPVAANSTVPLNFGTLGKRFATGIAIAATGAIGATDTTNAVAGVQINGTYI